MDDDLAYFRQRVVEERKAAVAAAGTDAELIHRDRVERYARLVQKWEPELRNATGELESGGVRRLQSELR